MRPIFANIHHKIIINLRLVQAMRHFIRDQKELPGGTVKPWKEGNQPPVARINRDSGRSLASISAGRVRGVWRQNIKSKENIIFQCQRPREGESGSGRTTLVCTNSLLLPKRQQTKINRERCGGKLDKTEKNKLQSLL